MTTRSKSRVLSAGQCFLAEVFKKHIRQSGETTSAPLTSSIFTRLLSSQHLSHFPYRFLVVLFIIFYPILVCFLASYTILSFYGSSAFSSICFISFPLFITIFNYVLFTFLWLKYNFIKAFYCILGFFEID